MKKTRRVKLCPGLYITGELQDYDGPCGGYNLNHAWLTGSACGKGCRGKVQEKWKIEGDIENVSL